MKIKLLIFNSLIIVLLISCVESFPNKLEKYINNNCNFETSDTYYIDFRKILNIDYDKFYVFTDIGLYCIKDIIGDGKSKYQNIVYTGYDPEERVIIFLKNNQVVYENKYLPNIGKPELAFYNFPIVKGQSVFDGRPIEVDVYVSKEHIFKVKDVGTCYIITVKTHAP